MELCLLSLNSLTHPFIRKIPCLVAYPGTVLILLECDLRGNQKYISSGMVLLDSQATISSCKINYHKAGGIYAHCTRDR